MNTSKIALVTGGSRGLGRDMALKLAQQGIDIILTYRRQQAEAAAVVAAIEALGCRAVALALNVADVSTFASFFGQVSTVLPATFGTDRFDFLVNNAGTGLQASITETTEAQFEELFNVHLKGVFFFTQRALPLLRNGGRILNISSSTTRTAFAANSIAPSAVFNCGDITDTPEVRAWVAQTTALGRVAEPDDIGGIVAFLCTDAARWLNGQRIEATGGIAL
jgi:NAD(P)-dependent dehydrogenase (short-subunit alcohol dehydrogenase family)